MTLTAPYEAGMQAKAVALWRAELTPRIGQAQIKLEWQASQDIRLSTRTRVGQPQRETLLTACYES